MAEHQVTSFLNLSGVTAIHTTFKSHMDELSSQHGDILTLVSDGDAGSHGSLLLLDHNHVYIAYLDSDRGDVMLIYREFVPTEAMYLPLIEISQNSG